MDTAWAISLDKKLVSGQSYSGIVLAVHSKVTYLEKAKGELISLCPKEIGNAPNIIRLEPYVRLAQSIQKGDSFSYKASKFHFEAKLELDCLQALLWEPKTSFNFSSGWERKLEYGYLLLKELGHHDAHDLLRDPENDIVSIVQDRKWDRLDGAVRVLVGLGPGLTPAGDDFLSGFGAALHYASAAFPKLFVVVEKVAASIQHNLVGHTHPVSEFFTLEAIVGRTSEAYQEVFEVLIAGKGADLAEKILNLIVTGETSGTEMLQGMLAGLNVVRKEISYSNKGG